MAHYLDHAATTPVRESAIEAMLPLLRNDFGNPSGSHRLARSANRVLDDSREIVASALGVQPGDVVFTSGGTEADNLAVQGVLDTVGGLAVCPSTEHHAVLDPVRFREGLVAPVDAAGIVDVEALADLLDSAPEPVTIVSVMLANNETGVIQPLDRVAAVVREHAPGAVLHTDAVQATCWLDLVTACADADLISISAHKFGGPKGVGALAVRNGIPLAPLAHGGGQERGRRNGTQNVPGIAAMAAALDEAVRERSATVERVGRLRDQLADGITAALDGVHESAVVDGDRSNKLPNICHLAFDDVDSEALLFLLEKNDVMASAASSCSSGAQDPSHVLAAMGMPRRLAAGSLRLSLGHASTSDDVVAALDAVVAAVNRLRSHRATFPSAGRAPTGGRVDG